MSIVRCERCDILIDSDFDVECFRKEFDDKVLCDSCYDEVCREQGVHEEALWYEEMNRIYNSERM